MKVLGTLALWGAVLIGSFVFWAVILWDKAGSAIFGTKCVRYDSTYCGADAPLAPLWWIVVTGIVSFGVPVALAYLSRRYLRRFVQGDDENTVTTSGGGAV